MGLSRCLTHPRSLLFRLNAHADPKAPGFPKTLKIRVASLTKVTTSKRPRGRLCAIAFRIGWSRCNDTISSSRFRKIGAKLSCQLSLRRITWSKIHEVGVLDRGVDGATKFTLFLLAFQPALTYVPGDPTFHPLLALQSLEAFLHNIAKLLFKHSYHLSVHRIEHGLRVGRFNRLWHRRGREIEFET